MTRPHIEFIQSQALPWQPASWEGMHEKTEIKSLSHDEETGECSVLVKYPAGWSRNGDEYLTVDEELFVLGGTLEINGVQYGEKSYGHLPAGYQRQSSSTQEGAVVLTFFSGEPQTEKGVAPSQLYGKSRLVERIDALNSPLSQDLSVFGVDQTGGDLAENLTICSHLLFREDPYTHEQTWVLSAPPLWQGGVVEVHPVVEEMYLVTGELATDTGLMVPGAYFWRPPGERHGPFGTKTGNLMFFRTKGGPLQTECPTDGKSFTWTPEHRPILPPELEPFGRMPGKESLCY